MTDNPGAAEVPSGADGPSGSGEAAVAPRRNPMPWLLVTVLVVLAAVLAYAVVMVVRMLA